MTSPAANPVLNAIAGEYRRYRALAEQAAGQLSDEELYRDGSAGANSTATVMHHVGGNLKSRFTDFLTTDGEKPWRNRDSEFTGPPRPRAALLQLWHDGWMALDQTLAALSDADLRRTVVIRRQNLTVIEALQRSLAHISYHAGQIVYIARLLRGQSWQYLSVPPGKTAEYNLNPTHEKPPSRFSN